MGSSGPSAFLVGSNAPHLLNGFERYAIHLDRVVKFQRWDHQDPGLFVLSTELVWQETALPNIFLHHIA